MATPTLLMNRSASFLFFVLMFSSLLAEDPDPLIWLEDVEGERALSWVREQNARSLEILESDRDFEAYQSAAVDILTSDDRIAYGTIRGDWVYNFWQDDEHVRGIWRRTSRESYGEAEPDWETILDVDQLAQEEDKNWVYKWATVHHDKEGDRYYALVSLSDGGKDAVVRREFNIETGQFIEDGFFIPEAKSRVAWIDKDSLLIGTDWGEGSLTESGYPRVVKRLRRGQMLEEAETVFTGEITDVAVNPLTLEMDDGTQVVGISQAITFYDDAYWWLPRGGGEALQFPLPAKSDINGVYEDQLLVSLRQDWALESQETAFRSGDVVSFDLRSLVNTTSLPPVELVFRPDKTQAVNFVSVSKNAALLSINQNVVGRILKLLRTATGWQTEEVELPGAGTVGIVFSDREENEVFLNYEDFLTPDSLLSFDPVTGEIETLRSVPPKFDAGGLVVEQQHVASKDGTRIPYFLIRKKDTPTGQSTPTVLYGYGGFQISMRPRYNPTVGKLWLEQGNAYVVANIRGGGEFGPDWHQAGLKTNRQRIYDDFIAVGEDLIASGLTSPEHLGIMGGSNGGLLMGVMLNQRPDLWNAVVIQVPLLDMLRYHKMLAGASWVGEYGSPDIPREREFLESISPYHNFNASKPYPVPFFVTSTKDDRVHPAHARKMAMLFAEAELPFLYYENIDGGHSAAANQIERAKRTALEFIYLRRQLVAIE
ncbi:MAG: prolyl oligopeptidase family serine peptidase [Verrucomicrobiota bacterium]